MKILILLITTFYCSFLQAQTCIISGMVTNDQGEAIAGANVYLQDTYDGASSDSDGHFTFSTEETDSQTLLVSAVGYESAEHFVTITSASISLQISLKEAIQKMNGVTVTAGALDAGVAGKVTTLNPLDIVTTASAMGDIAGALQTMPGTQAASNDGRLFVRGGESYETKVYIDGVLTHTPFNAKVPNLPTRGRFSPFLFKGTNLSTGGYSAEYGQALSSALVLNTLDFPEQNQTDISVMSVGADVAHQHRGDKTSISAKAEYSNLAPYQALIPQNYGFEKAPETGSGSLVLRRKTSETGMLKLYGNYSRSALAMYQPDIDHPQSPVLFKLHNNNLYLNASYRELINKKWSVRSGIGYTLDDNRLAIGGQSLDERLHGLHTKTVFTLDASASVALHVGAGYMYNQYDQQQALANQIADPIGSTFAEADVYLTNRWVARPGIRMEYAARMQKLYLAPRFSLAYKTSEYGQLSMAYGRFNQAPEAAFLQKNQQLGQEEAAHYILNYQVVKEGRTFRAEVYHKHYDHLVKAGENSLYTNKGDGYARGLDLFWRDKQLIRGGDFWVSYSLLDTKRSYHDFPTAATPAFAAKHNFSVVYKHFISTLRTQAGFSYSIASGRPYANPNNSVFHADRTPAYHNLSLNAAHLIDQNIILYAAVSNVLGTKQIFGYEYSRQPNEQGIYDRHATGPAAPRFIFVGLFITLTKDQQANQLDNL